ncbi:MAG: hypothetical protein AAF203_00375 [Pseudomonadota bacterium]
MKTTIMILVLMASFGAFGEANKAVDGETIEITTHKKNKKATRKVEKFLAANTVDRTYNYCIPGTLTCRQLQIFRNNGSQEISTSFNNVFSSARRSVGSDGYFIERVNGRYRNFLDDKFDGDVKITQVFRENQNLEVTFDDDGLPTVHNMTLKRLGTTRLVMADLIYTDTESRIVGVELDTADPTYSKPVNILYLRVF